MERRIRQRVKIGCSLVQGFWFALPVTTNMWDEHDMRKIAFETPLNNPKNENKKNGKLMEQNVHYVIKRAGFPWVWQRYLLIVEGGAEPLRCPLSPSPCPSLPLSPYSLFVSLSLSPLPFSPSMPPLAGEGWGVTPRNGHKPFTLGVFTYSRGEVSSPPLPPSPH